MTAEPKQTAQAQVQKDTPEVLKEGGELGITAELVLHPFNNASQALWLCQQLKERLQAEILYVSAFPEGTAIKVLVRKQVPMVDFLLAMKEVAEAWEEPVHTVSPGGKGAAYLTMPKAAKTSSTVVCVALRPF